MNKLVFPEDARPPQSQVSLQFADEKDLPLVDAPIGRDISALVVVGRTLFCACDETSTLERLVFDPNTRAFGEHRNYPLSDAFDLPNGPKGEMDIEGLAWDGSVLWMTGSHSLKRTHPDADHHGLKALSHIGWDRNRGFVGTLPILETAPGVYEPMLEPQASGGARDAPAARMMRMGKGGKKSLRKLLKSDPLLKRFLKVPAKENGFDIEGLAVFGGRLVFGLRGPVLGNHSLLLSMQLEPGSDGHLKPVESQGEKYRLHAVDLDGSGIRDLLAVDGKLLVLSGPTQSIEGMQRICCIDALPEEMEVVSHEQIGHCMTLPLRAGHDHAEGIARLDLDGEALLLVAYDSPARERYNEPEHRLLLDVFPFPSL